MALQKTVSGAICGDAGGAQNPFVGAPKAVYGSLSLIAAYRKRGALAKTEFTSALSVNRERQSSRYKAGANSGCVLGGKSS